MKTILWFVIKSVAAFTIAVLVLRFAFAINGVVPPALAGALALSKFVETESTFDYFQATREYLEAHRKPVTFYSDKHGVFRVNSTGTVEGDGMTKFGRSLHALNIDILWANTPQAKGRGERANKTLQDRLVKELRLQGISTTAVPLQGDRRFESPSLHR